MSFEVSSKCPMDTRELLIPNSKWFQNLFLATATSVRYNILCHRTKKKVVD